MLQPNLSIKFNNMRTKKISVCIATYNGEKYISDQINSILSQLNPNDEVIISDDHSTDCTIDIIKNLNDKRIKIYLNEGEKGSTANFENALKKSSGDYIFLADQDDVWVDNKVEICLDYFDKYDFIVSDATVVDQYNKVLYDSFFSIRKPYQSFWGNLFKFGYIGCCFAFKKDVLEKSLPFPRNHKLSTHDNWLFMVAAMFFKVKVLSDKLILYKRHGSNISTGGFMNNTSFLFKLQYRLYLFIFLLKRTQK